MEHFNQWGSVIFFIVLYSLVLLFIPFYKKMSKKPSTAYMAFVIAFAIEMHGIPLTLFFFGNFLGKNLPEGILWGHTLYQYIGHTGMYIGIAISLVAIFIIANGWYNIYHKYWKLTEKKRVVKEGIYKYIRHPQYTGFMLLMVGMLLNWATLPTLIMFPIMIWIYYGLAKREEKDMINEFGEEYIQYMQHTKRFLPYVV